MSDDDAAGADGEGIAHLAIPVAIFGCIVYIFVGIAIHHYKETYHHMPWIHESSVVCLVGVIMGGIIKITTGVPITFDSNLFFYLVLPPIIFSAGYSLKRRNFFKYMDLIAFFGIVGTVVNFVLIAAGAYAYGRVVEWPGCFQLTWYEALVFSAVLTGSDEVSARSLVRIKDFPRMGALIFGEGVVNDAMSIVLFKTFLPLYDAEFKSISLQPQLVYPTPSTMSILNSVITQVVFSTIIGLSCGLVHARLMKGLPAIKHFPIYQTALVLLFGYMSYCIAEVFGISGILTIFIAAITLAHYSWYNISSSAQIATRISFAGISEIAEGFAFSYVGLSLWTYDDPQINILFSVYMMVVVLLARTLGFLALFKLCSFCMPSFRLPVSEQLCFVLGGVVRGCLCWAQILQVGHSPVLITTTLIIVMFTSLASGVLLPMLLPLLQPAPEVALPYSPLKTIVPFPRNTTPHNARGDNGHGRLFDSEAKTPLMQSGIDLEAASNDAHQCTEESQQESAHADPASLHTPVRSRNNGDSSSEGEQSGGRRYHFAYEPFSADFPHTQPRDRSAIHSPVRNPALGNAPPPQYPEMLSPDPLDDLRTNEELIELISSQQAVNRPSLVAMLFWQWVRFDETFMKPLFGGSDRRYRLLLERSRQHALELPRASLETESVDHPAIMLSSSVSVELPPLHPRGASSRDYGSMDSVEAQVGNQQDLPQLATHQKQRGIAESGTAHKPPNAWNKSSISKPRPPPLQRQSPQQPLTMGIVETVDKIFSPGGRAYVVLGEDREDELVLDKMADDICALDRSLDEE
jgi:NhaP-type Na+/H+ or K+/H+ antiporter